MRGIGELLLALLLAAPAVAAPKTDVLILRNGDHLTGEIKGLDRGKLTFNTDATGDIGVEWEDVAQLISTRKVRLETAGGEIYLGELVESGAPATLRIADDAGRELPMITVVRMSPIEARWVDQIDGDVYAGLSIVSANDLKEFDFGGDAEYRTEELLLEATGNYTTTSSNETEETTRGVLNVETYRLWPERWFSGFLGRLERNDDLGIDLRTSLGGGGGRFVSQSDSQIWKAFGGLLYTRERYTGDEDNAGFFEGYAGLTWDWFHFDEPELDLSSTLLLFPNLTDTGRLRGSFNLTLKWEIFRDFFWRINYSSDYDNQPRDPEAETYDYALDTSLGWEF